MSIIGPSAAYQATYGLFKNAIVLTTPEQVSDVFYGTETCVILMYWHKCGHCTSFAPTYDEAAEQYHKKIKLYAIDVEKAEPRGQLPADQFFSDGGVPRVAAVENGVIKETVKGNDPSKFMALLKKLVTPV